MNESFVARLAYYVRVIAIYFIFGQLFFRSGLEKLTQAVPDWFRATFGGTPLASFPGLEISWRVLGVMEILVVIVLIISVVRLEFLENRGKLWLKLSLMVAALTFAMLAFGQRLVGEFSGAANLFFYFGATMVTLLVVDKDHDAAVNAVDRKGA